MLGANGAGKTTETKMIRGPPAPTSGRISLPGRPALAHRLQVTAAQLVWRPPELREKRKQRALAAAGLDVQGGLLTGKLPAGRKQRVGFGASAMHEPEFALLDEPASEVDPLARRAMWQTIDELASHGAAVLVLTHYLEEAEPCNRRGSMADGAMVVQVSPGRIERSMEGGAIELQVCHPRRSLGPLRQAFGAANASLFGDRLNGIATELGAAHDHLCSTLGDAAVSIARMDLSESSLDNVFLRPSFQRGRDA